LIGKAIEARSRVDDPAAEQMSLAFWHGLLKRSHGGSILKECSMYPGPAGLILPHILQSERRGG
jgi:hypothetical protein